jgi:peptide deformylase
MVETMYAAPGVGLAAPQLGEAVRLIAVDLSIGREKGHLHVLINPEIFESEGEQFEEEGCLSLPDVTERVRRFGHVRVRALNREGKEVVLDAQEMLSRVLQHEIDHLDGKLLLDRLSRVKRDLIKRRLKKQAKAAPAR